MKFIALFLVMIFYPVHAIKLTTVPVNIDTNSPLFNSIEPNISYNFSFPIIADVLNQSNYQPSFSNRYFMSLFGPRFKQVSSSNIGYFDFHRGTDITAVVEDGSTIYSEINPPPIMSMCDGVVTNINTNSNDAIGLSVTVKCNRLFNIASWGNIYIAYRHLSIIDVNLMQTISSGQQLGIMGRTGATSTVHLHLSVQRQTNNGKVNVHPMRIFTPINHLSTALINSPTIELLKHSQTSALFRITNPYNQSTIRAIRISNANNDWSRTYDFEEVSEFATDENRDHNNWKSGLELFAYPFNRGHTSYRRYIDNDNIMPIFYPAALANQTDDFMPILSDTSNTPVNYSLDIRVTDLPIGYDIAQYFIEIYDIWGNGSRAQAVNSSNISRAHVLIDPENDAEESNSGNVNTTRINLTMVDKNTSNNQIVGLQFPLNNIPQNASIINAYIQFSADKANNENTQLAIELENTSSPLAFNQNNTLSQRNILIELINWNIPAWENVDDMTSLQKSPNLADLIQPLIMSNSWNISDKKLSFILSGTGKRVADSGDNFFKHKIPYIYIEYDTTQAIFDVIFKNNFEILLQ